MTEWANDEDIFKLSRLRAEQELEAEDKMTEEIIKVERCAFIGSDGHCLSPINGSNKYCDKVPEKWYYYKQLQRLKQENEQLKEEINCQKARARIMCISAKNYRKALEKIKKYINSISLSNAETYELIRNKINEVLNEQ